MANSINTAIAAVETALGNITVDGGYNFDLGSTEYIGAENAGQVHGSRPCVYVLSASDSSERFSSSKLYRIITVTIQGITAGAQNRQLREDAALLWADIEKALYADKTLGSTVTTLRYVSGAVEFQRESNSAVIELSFELDIHYTEGTP